MYQFESMPVNAKVWVYAANRIFTADEQKAIENSGRTFASKWLSHDIKLKASFDILHGVFLVLMVDENVNPAGGCATDTSYHFIREIEKEFSVQLFNRMQVELMKDENIIITSKQGATTLFNEGKIGEETFFFNKSIISKKEFDEKFMIPFSGSWVFYSIRQTESI